MNGNYESSFSVAGDGGTSLYLEIKRITSLNNKATIGEECYGEGFFITCSDPLQAVAFAEQNWDEDHHGDVQKT